MTTDPQLQQDVIAALQRESSVTAPGIGVEVKDGIVTLAGEVGSYAEKLHAEHAAQRVGGVKALAVELKVRRSGTGTQRDADIAQAVQDALAWSTSVPDKALQVMVENGWVNLSGSVDWHYQRQAAIDGVQKLSGVTGVSDQISVRTQLAAPAVAPDTDPVRLAY